MSIVKNIIGKESEEELLPYPDNETKERWAYIEYYNGLVKRDEDQWRELARKLYRMGAHKSPLKSKLPETICEVSADLLVGEHPRIKHSDPDDMSRLLYGLSENNFFSKLLAAAKTVSGSSEIWCKVFVDPSTPLGRRVPRISFIPGNRVIARYHGDELIEARVLTYWSSDKKDYEYRLEEVHEPGYVSHVLYFAKNGTTGKVVDLTELPQTALLEPRVQTGAPDYLTIVRVPNNIDFDCNEATSDIDGLEEDILDLAETKRLGQANLTAAQPTKIVNKTIAGRFGETNWGPNVVIVEEKHQMTNQAEKMVEVIQPDFPSDKYTSWGNEILQFVLMLSGTNPQLAGFGTDGGATSALQEKLKMLRSTLKASGKAEIWEKSLGTLLHVYMVLDSQTFGTAPYIKQGYTYNDIESVPTVEFQDGIPADEDARATTTINLVSAGLLSQYSAILRENPEYTDDDVQAELERIQEDKNKQDAVLTNALTASIAPTNPLIPPAASIGN